MRSTPKISVFIATSLDGFIARPDGNIDWLTRPEDQINEEDFGYAVFMNSVDVLVMGRYTFEKVASFDEWPYGSKPVIVLSSHKLEAPASMNQSVEVLSLPPADLVRQLQERGFHYVYLDGGQTIQRFIRAGLVDQLTVTRLPVLLGTGIPLFGALDSDVRLKHVRTTTYPNGFVQSVYRLNE